MVWEISREAALAADLITVWVLPARNFNYLLLFVYDLLDLLGLERPCISRLLAQPPWIT